MAIQVTNTIHWVGQKDWEIRDFHSTEYTTHPGISYNSYLIREGKNVLIDTVDHKLSCDFVANLTPKIDLKTLNHIIINHAEKDYADALTEPIACIPNTPTIVPARPLIL